MPDPRAEVAVIGGSGFYDFLPDVEHVTSATPYGDPAAPIAIGRLADRPVAFLPRHGRGHQFPPHRVPYRANLWALRTLGVRRVLAPCAVGSLRTEWGPGTLVVPDQLVDRTSGRCQTFVDEGAGHVGFADPYCPDLRRALVGADPSVRDGGTMVVVEGPRFSTRAESRWHAAQGWSLVNMTGHPEAVLARELGMCYATMALVTDRDAGVSREDSVDQAAVFAEFGRSVDRLRDLLTKVVANLGEAPACDCAKVGVALPFDPPW